jgi:hypothetical protein
MVFLLLTDFESSYTTCHFQFVFLKRLKIHQVSQGYPGGVVEEDTDRSTCLSLSCVVVFFLVSNLLIMQYVLTRQE